MPVKKRDKGKMRATLTAAQPPAGGANPSPPGRGGWGHPGVVGGGAQYFSKRLAPSGRGRGRTGPSGDERVQECTPGTPLRGHFFLTLDESTPILRET